MSFLISAVLGFFTGPLKKAIVWLIKHPWVLAIVILCGVIAFEHIKVSYWSGKAHKTEQQLHDLQGRYTNLVGLTTEQNKHVQQLKQQSDAQAQRLRRAAQAAQQHYAQAQRKLQRLQDEQVPKNCPGAVAWGAKQGEQLTWSK